VSTTASCASADLQPPAAAATPLDRLAMYEQMAVICPEASHANRSIQGDDA